MTINQGQPRLNNDKDFNFTVQMRAYSPAVLGYRLIMRNEKHFIINENLSAEDRKKAFDKLFEVEADYSIYGLLILQSDGTFYANPDYTYNHTANFHLYEPDGVVNIEAERRYRKYMKKGRC